jgi:peroxiredoxin
MAPELHTLVLIILVISVAINLKLTFILIRRVNPLVMANTPELTCDIGEKLPAFNAYTYEKKAFDVSRLNKACALIFLSSRCPQCKEKLKDIRDILPNLTPAGLELRLVSLESRRRLKSFFETQDLLEKCLLTDKSNYLSLNPRSKTPFYLFVDHNGHLEAAGTLGDENWQGFLQQMQHIEQEAYQ